MPCATIAASTIHTVVDAETPARAGTVGRYTVTAFPSAARTILADTCRRILGDNGSALELYVTTSEPEDALAALSSGTVDLAVIHSYSNVPRDVPRGITTRAIGTEPVWLATPKAPDQGRPPSSTRLEHYAAQPWIVATGDVTCRDMVERACGLAGYKPAIVADSMDFSVQLHLVAAGVGVALIPDLTIEHVPEGIELIRLHLPIERTLHLAVRNPSLADPGIQNLTRIIEESAAAQQLVAHDQRPRPR